MKKTQITELLIFIVAAELVGAVSALLSGSFTFFNELIKPPLSPPGWIFPIVWSILYALMGISAYRIYISGANQDKKDKALAIYCLQLFVNFLWSIVFFRFRLLGGSSAVILILLAFIIWMIISFYKIDRISAYLNIPYLIWVLYATYLNIGILFLN